MTIEQLRKIIREEIADSTNYEFHVGSKKFSANKTNKKVFIGKEELSLDDFKKMVNFAKKNGILESRDNWNIADFLKLKKENGITRTSLENAQKIVNSIKKQNGKIVSATLDFDKEKNSCVLEIEFTSDGEEGNWKFTGFNAGYSGEGPRGLVQALKMLNLPEWTINDVRQLQSGVYDIL